MRCASRRPPLGLRLFLSLFAVSRRFSLQPSYHLAVPSKKERKKTDNPREGWENGTPPPHRDFKERGVVR